MNILYDHQTFTGPLYGGVSRYFYDLIRSFSNTDSVNFDLSLLFSNNEYLKDTKYANNISYRPFAKNRRLNQIASLLNREYSKIKIKKNDFDVFHPTYYHPYFLKSIVKSKPVVLTFHDTVSEEFGRQYPDLGEGLTDRKKVCLDRADAVITISEATKREMLKWFEVDEKKITVIPHGNPFSEPMIANYTPKLQLPERYVLYVGVRQFYKNFERFVVAMSPILAKDNGLKIVCAGSGSFDTSEKQLFEQHKMTNNVVQVPIENDDTLIELYSKAQVFVYPSLMEGFGIPIVEAMSCGCPVVASDGTSFNEIALDAALYFDPKNVESMRYAIETVVYNSSKQAQMRALGKGYSACFTVPKMADATLNLYRSLI